MLWHIMRYYRQFEVRDFVLCLGYRGDLIKDFFLHYNVRAADIEIDLGRQTHTVLCNGHDAQDWRVLLAETGLETQTGTRIKKVLSYLRNDMFLATYGDGLADIDLEELVEHHQRVGRLATVTAVHPSSRFGELSLNGHMVSAFDEKPQVSQGWINGGFFVFQREAFDYLPDGDETLEKGLLERLAAAEQLSVYRHHGFWQCMDTYREMELLDRMWREDRAPWKVW